VPDAGLESLAERYRIEISAEEADVRVSQISCRHGNIIQLRKWQPYDGLRVIAVVMIAASDVALLVKYGMELHAPVSPLRPTVRLQRR
jgi:hypothetical protein